MAIQNSADQFLTGTGILVSGDPFRANTTGFQGVALKDGREEYFCAVAFPKDQPAATRFDELYALMQQEAVKHKYAASYQATQWVGFHWKMEDGDAPQNVNKPGWKGCWVIKFKNGFQPQVFDVDQSAVPSPYNDTVGPDGKKVQQLKGAHTFPCGHYVRVLCSIKCNDSAPPQSGIYINFHMIQRVGYGTPIVSGPDYTSILNQAPAASLAGMSTMPVGGTTPAMSAQPGMPPAAGGMPGLPGAGMPPATPAAPVTPGAGMPPAAPAPAAAPAVPPAAPVVEGPQSRMIATDYTYDQYISSGWTEEALVANGKMQPAAAAAPMAPPAAPMAPPAAPAAPGGHPYNA